MEENQNWPFIFTGILGISGATAISYALYIRARHQQNLELIASSFPHVVNFSLNFMENGTLKFRTLFETNIAPLARNPVLAQILSDSRDGCTEERAFFSEPRQKPSFFSSCRCCRRLRVKIWGPQIEWKKASEHLHMAILNELSSRYSQGHFGHGIIGLKIPSTVQPKHTQLDVVSETFCFGLTCEQNKDVRAKKVRVMIVAKDFLRHQVSNSAPEPKLERPGHWVRWRTLLEMKQIMEEEERQRAQGIRRVSRVWEVTLSFMVPRLKATSMLMWQKEGVVTNLEALSKQLRSSSDAITTCTGHGPRGKGARKKFQTHHESGTYPTATGHRRSVTMTDLESASTNRRASYESGEQRHSSHEQINIESNGGAACEPDAEPTSTMAKSSEESKKKETVLDIRDPPCEAPAVSASATVVATSAAVMPVVEQSSQAALEANDKPAQDSEAGGQAQIYLDDLWQRVGEKTPEPSQSGEKPEQQLEQQDPTASASKAAPAAPATETLKQEQQREQHEEELLPVGRRGSSEDYDEGVEVESLPEEEESAASPATSPICTNTDKAITLDEEPTAEGKDRTSLPGTIDGDLLD